MNELSVVSGAKLITKWTWSVRIAWEWT